MKVIKNGQVLTENGLEQVDVQFDEDQILAIGKDLFGDEVIDAQGKVVLPGLVDVHVHLREPGREKKETIQTGSGCPWWIYIHLCDAKCSTLSF